MAILGISKVTSEERLWWGPDGNTETSVPEFYCKSQPPQDAHLDRRYEIVWLVDWPPAPFGATHFSWALRSRSNPSLLSCPACDRYGERYWCSSDMDTVEIAGSLSGRMTRCFYAGGIACTPPDTQTTFSLGLRFDKGNVEWVTFKNVSLRPGENPGFEIVQGVGDTP